MRTTRENSDNGADDIILITFSADEVSSMRRMFSKGNLTVRLDKRILFVGEAL